MADYERRIDDFRTTIMSIHSHTFDNTKLRFISPDVLFILLQKWKKLMLKSLQLVAEFSYAD
jgi:hypothetical protein